MQSRNRNFLLALTEVANPDARIRLIAPVMGEHDESAETVDPTTIENVVDKILPRTKVGGVEVAE